MQGEGAEISNREKDNKKSESLRQREKERERERKGEREREGEKNKRAKRKQGVGRKEIGTLRAGERLILRQRENMKTYGENRWELKERK